MIKCTISLNKSEEYGICAPTILLEDETGDEYPLIFPDDMKEEAAIKELTELVEIIESKYTLVREIKKLMGDFQED